VAPLQNAIKQLNTSNPKPNRNPKPNLKTDPNPDPKPHRNRNF